MKRLLVVLAAGLMLLAPSVVYAFDSGGNPGTTGANTITWTGQGSENVNDEHCNGDTPNPGDILFIFTTDGGSASNALLYVNGGSAISPNEGNSNGSQFHFYTNVDTLIGLTAYATFTVDDPGNGAWNLVISHGCPGEAPEADAPTVTKDAAGSYDNTYTWDITKDVDKTWAEVTPGGSVTFHYTVTVSHDSGTISNVKVDGTITVTNPNGVSLNIDGVTDELSDNTVCTVTDGGAQTLPAGDTTFAYSCDLSSLPTSDLFNTATVTWSEQTLGDNSHLAAGSADFTIADPIAFTGTDIDECVDVDDSFALALGTVCVGDSNPTAFTYDRTINAGTLGECVAYDNTATFTTNDTGATDSASQRVTVCTYNARLTIGYWRNHLNPISSTCRSKDGCSSNGPWTFPLLGTSICAGECTVGHLGNYVVNSQLKAKNVFDANNCSNASTSNSNAAACLAAQLLGAELNVANKANPCICDTIQAANAFLTAVGYAGPGSTVHFDATHTRAMAIALKTALDNYNNGLPCPS